MNFIIYEIIDGTYSRQLLLVRQLIILMHGVMVSDIGIQISLMMHAVITNTAFSY